MKAFDAGEPWRSLTNFESSNRMVRYILGREKVAEGYMGSDEFMRERGSDSSYYRGAGRRTTLA